MGYDVGGHLSPLYRKLRDADIYATKHKEEVFVEVHCGRLANQLRKYKRAIEKLKEPTGMSKWTKSYDLTKYKIIVVFPIDDAENIEVWGFKELSSKK